MYRLSGRVSYFNLMVVVEECEIFGRVVLSYFSQALVNYDGA